MVYPLFLDGTHIHHLSNVSTGVVREGRVRGKRSHLNGEEGNFPPQREGRGI